MFTGIVETTTKLESKKTDGEITSLKLARPKGWKLRDGQSISHNGVCLTVVDFDDDSFTVELMPETLAKSTFGSKMPNEFNLERAMAADGLFEGHIVQGHVDHVGKIIDVIEDEKWRTLKIAYPGKNQNLLVPKGSVALDGVSLTIVDVDPEWFSVSLIPHTLEITTLGELKKGSEVNIEYDIIGKYISKSLGLRNGSR